MGNQWFKFKQFEIRQDQCAMKVGTDGVILGAWTNASKAKSALDIGTGTGLLALMLAQQNSNIVIDAIEIEKNSAAQAASNFDKSPFASRITAHETSLQNFLDRTSGREYDLIICNPPYFTESYRATGKERSLARHDDSLPVNVLLQGSANLLAKEGILSLVLPYDVVKGLIALAAEFGLFPLRQLLIRPTPQKDIKRVCLELGFSITEDVATETLVIEENGRHNYSEVYSKLTQDFYLDF